MRRTVELEPLFAGEAPAPSRANRYLTEDSRDEVGRTGVPRRGAGVESAEARERLLRAAQQLFADKGFAATRVQEITDAAGVNKALLYYYFEDKHSIYVALVEEAIADFEAMLQGALDSPGTYADRLGEFVRQHVLLIRRCPERLRMIQRSQATGEVENVGELKRRFKENLVRIEAFIAEGIEAGEFREIDPRMAAFSILALNSGFANFQADQCMEYSPDQVADHSVRLVLDGFRRR